MNAFPSIPRGTSLYYALLFSPTKHREAATSLFHFFQEIDRLVHKNQEMTVTNMKLQWWRQEITRTFSENAQHPVTQHLFPFIKQYHFSKTWFEDFIEGTQRTLDPTPFATTHELITYCYQQSGVKTLLLSKIAGYQEEATLEFASCIGIAIHLILLIRDFGKDHQKKYFSEENITQQAQLAKTYYQKAIALLPNSDQKKQNSLLILAKIYFTLLDEIEREHFKVQHQKYSLTALRKLWIAWTHSFLY